MDVDTHLMVRSSHLSSLWKRALLAALVTPALLAAASCARPAHDADVHPAGLQAAADATDAEQSLAIRDDNTVHPHGIVYVFLSHECPICNAYAPEIARLAGEYATRGFGFTMVYVDPALTRKAAADHARAYRLPGDAVLEREHNLVPLYGATITPEVALVHPKQGLVYRGRIDDLYVDFGRRRLEPSRRDLRAALDAVLAGRDIPNPRTVAVGCYITPAK
jgi:thiol-disulfide isomerase/thioredoxin